MNKAVLRTVLAGTAAVMAIAAAPAGNWLATFSQVDGGHRIGNPDADVLLTEFVSYTCPHCAHFEKEAEGTLKLQLVQPGTAKVEVRHFIRDPIDLTAALLTNCGPKEKFFANHTAVMLQQDAWMGKARETTDAQRQRWANGPYPARWKAIASDTGLAKLMEDRGYQASEINACLSNVEKAQQIVDQSQADIEKYSLPGTPSFAVNGKVLAETHSWAKLKPQLESILGAK